MSKDPKPLWMYGEGGIEFVPQEIDLGEVFRIESNEVRVTQGDGDEIYLDFDKKTMRKIKWLYLKSAIKWFFSRE